MIAALTTVLVFQLAGDILVSALRLPVPGPVAGLVLLYAALILRGGTPEQLTAASAILLQHLTLFLIPVTTGLMLHLPRLGAEWAPILVAGVGGTALTLATTATTLRALARRPAGR